MIQSCKTTQRSLLSVQLCRIFPIKLIPKKNEKPKSWFMDRPLLSQNVRMCLHRDAYFHVRELWSS